MIKSNSGQIFEYEFVENGKCAEIFKCTIKDESCIIRCRFWSRCVCIYMGGGSGTFSFESQKVLRPHPNPLSHKIFCSEPKIDEKKIVNDLHTCPQQPSLTFSCTIVPILCPSDLIKTGMKHLLFTG